MKKLLFAALLLISVSAFANTRIDEKIERNFRKSFPTARAVKWYDNKDHFEVYFLHNNMQCRISYNTDGTLQQMRRDYKKEHLPLFIAGAVQQKYPDQQVYGVTEITSPDGIQYHLVLQDAKNWYFVNADSGGSISLSKKLRKA